MRELGLGEQLQTAIPMPSGEFVGITFERRADEGRHSSDQIAMMNGLRPHLARAGLIASRLELKQASNMVDALSALGLPAAVLRQSGSVLSANDLFEVLDGLFIARAFGGLVLSDPNADRLLQAAVESSRMGGGKSSVRSIPVATQPGRAAHVVHLVPLRRAAHDIFASADVLVVVSTVGRPADIPLNTVVTTLFDLSPAESRLAIHLARGIPLAEAAQICGITISSARTYLNRVFQKTGTHRQGELVALLLSAQLLAPTPE